VLLSLRFKVLLPYSPNDLLLLLKWQHLLCNDSFHEVIVVLAWHLRALPSGGPTSEVDSVVGHRRHLVLRDALLDLLESLVLEELGPKVLVVDLVCDQLVRKGLRIGLLGAREVAVVAPRVEEFVTLAGGS